MPIFKVAREILIALPASKSLNDALDRLVAKAMSIVAKRGALRHDLMGRVYHRLLHEAKYLGTYYTSVPAATLLLKLTLAADSWPALDWGDLAAIKGFKVADLACGTGTLLMASVQALADLYVRALNRPGFDGGSTSWRKMESCQTTPAATSPRIAIQPN
jgi:hypothetical protein